MERVRDGLEVNGWRSEGTIFITEANTFCLNCPNPLPLESISTQPSDTFQEGTDRHTNSLEGKTHWICRKISREQESLVKAAKKSLLSLLPSSSWTHHRAPGAWWGWGPWSGTPPCAAYSHWCRCDRPCRTWACRCRRTQWDRRSSGRWAVPPRTQHWRDTPPYTLLQEKHNTSIWTLNHLVTLHLFSFFLYFVYRQKHTASIKTNQARYVLKWLFLLLCGTAGPTTGK